MERLYWARKDLKTLRRKGNLSWLSGKESACQCRRCRFDLWVGKMPWRRKWQPTPAFLSGKSHGQTAWWAIVLGITKELDDLVTKQ